MADDPLAAELVAIKGRTEAATPGPWWFDEDDRTWRLHGVHAIIPPFMEGMPEQVMNHQILKAPKQGTTYAEYWPSEADAAFIVAARTDVPRLVAALEAALNYHQPEQLYAMVEDFKGKVVCPHSPDYEGDLHFEADDGEWHCKALPTVVVCSSCADGSASDLREQWPCPTYTDITSALTGKAATVV